MRILSAIIVGLLSGFMIYMLSAMVSIRSSYINLLPYIFIFGFLSGAVVSGYFVAEGAKSAAKVWMRGAVLGAIEWVLVGLVRIIYSGTVLVTSTKGGASKAVILGTGLGAGLFSMINIGVAVHMAIACLIIYIIAKQSGEEFGD